MKEEAIEAAEKILDTLLGHLGFSASYTPEETDEGCCIQISSPEADLLCGAHGDRLDDIQYLVNRILLKHYPDAPRIRIDCDHYRAQTEERLCEEARKMAEHVKSTGKEMQMRPLNGYYRRIVHHALAQESGVKTESPKGDARLKRLTIRPDSEA